MRGLVRDGTSARSWGYCMGGHVREAKHGIVAQRECMIEETKTAKRERESTWVRVFEYRGREKETAETERIRKRGMEMRKCGFGWDFEILWYVAILVLKAHSLIFFSACASSLPFKAGLFDDLDRPCSGWPTLEHYLLKISFSYVPTNLFLSGAHLYSFS